MRIPEITPLQSFVLGVLCSGGASGKEIRAKLKGNGCNKSLPSFYQLMSRLEESGCVTGSYELIQISGKKVRERRYKITGQGRRALQQSIDFGARLEAMSKGGLQGA